MGMKNGAVTLMHLPKGQTWEIWNPSQLNKNAPRQNGVCKAICKL